MKHAFFWKLLFPPLAKPIWLLFWLGLFISLPYVTEARGIAILKSAEIEAYSAAIQAFKETLPVSLHVTSEYDLQGDIAKGQSLARKIRASNANLVLAVGLKAALVAKFEILDIPVILCLVLDPEKHGLPTSNMVGLSLQIPFEHQLKLLRTLLPKISSIGVLFDPQKTQAMKDRLEYSARNLGLTLISNVVRSEQEVADALKTLKEKVETLYLLPDSTVLTEHTLDFLISTTLEANIPILGFSADLIRSGALTGSYVTYADSGQHAAILAPMLLTTPKSSIFGTMVPPQVVHQAINVKSANYLGLGLAPETLRSFDEHY